jgi:hypothetical protein
VHGCPPVDTTVQESNANSPATDGNILLAHRKIAELRPASSGTDPAHLRSMFLLGFLTVASASLTVILYALRKAPEGYEDETGFHMIHGRAHYSGASILPRRPREREAVRGRLHLPLPAGAAGHFKA